VALASYAAFVDSKMNAPGYHIEGEDRLASASIMQYLKVTCSEENYKMLCFYHARSQPIRSFQAAAVFPILNRISMAV
jgi:hypothetical protein